MTGYNNGTKMHMIEDYIGNLIILIIIEAKKNIALPFLLPCSFGQENERSSFSFSENIPKLFLNSVLINNLKYTPYEMRMNKFKEKEQHGH